ncbi:MAG TPA: Wadjet anti-phage system protein JetD domain-containing protein [Nocardioidaceae bacterium]|nr:Wadjet anti-phage system protein JetD domain-containing protein [Nocardioidaceae bacterium]
MSRAWTTPRDIEAKVRRRWDDGSLLRAYAGAPPFNPIEIPVRGPKPSEIGDDLVAVRNWIGALKAGSSAGRRYEVVSEPVGGRHIGRNVLPARVVISTASQACALLGVDRHIQRFAEILDLTDPTPAVRAWVLAHPHRALELSETLPQLISAFSWLDSHRDSGRYLREISAPGVDTKFTEKHRSVLAAMLGVSSTAAGFLTDLGLRAKPEMVRIRVSPSLGLPAPLSELTLRATELRELAITPRSALVVENEITYLSVDVPGGGIVIWGKGFEVDRIGRLPWLADTPVIYWGDIDTHGFAILDRLRAWLPHTSSVLMDQQTLLTHRDRWVREGRPATSSLTRLTPAELDLYMDLVTDRLGRRIRLEQERVGWTWATSALQKVLLDPSSDTRSLGNSV